MPPRTRSNRAAFLKLQSLIASGEHVNSTGFASLPNEICGEIVSHIPRVPVSCHTLEEHKEFTEKEPTEKFERRATLHALSQTCRSLRSVFLRYLWQTIEVYDGLKLADGRRIPSWRRRIMLGSTNLRLKPFAEELLRQLEIVTVRNPSLAQHVNFINVILLPYSIATVYQELLQCIPLLPNLTSIRLYCDHPTTLHGAVSDIHRNSDFVFPQIRHAYLDRGCLPFASACPNLISLSSPSHYIKTRYNSKHEVWEWACIGDQICARIEVLGPIPFDKNLRTELRRLPNLRDITLGVRLASILVKDKHDYSNSFKRLQTVRIRADHLRVNYSATSSESAVPKPVEVDKWVGWAEKVLRRVQQHDKQLKRIYLTVHGGAQTLYLLEPEMATQSLALSF